MAVASVIGLSELEGAKRVDAEYYQPTFLMNAEMLSGCPTLKEIARRITDFGAYSQFNFIEYVKDGVRFLRNQDIGEVLIYDDEPIYISQEAYKLLSLKLENADLVVPRVGTLGKAAVITNDHLPCSANQNLAQVKLKKGVNPFWVAVFLSTRYGLFQTFRYSTGNVQPWLNLGQIENLKVFLTSEKDIEDRVIEKAMKSVELNKISKSLYSQAENLLLEELGLKDFKPKYELSFSANLSKAFGAHRVDAEYFQPAYEQLIGHINDRGACTIRQIQAFNCRGVQPIYVEGGAIRVVTSKNLGRDSIGYWSLAKTTSQEWDKNEDARIRKFDILTYTTGAYVGRTNCYLEDDKALASNHVNILRVRGITPVFVGVYLNSVAGQFQVKRCVSGSAQTELYPLDISKFIVWKAPEKIQLEIASLVQQSYEARKKAKELLEEAKSKVENLIEGEACPDAY